LPEELSNTNDWSRVRDRLIEQLDSYDSISRDEEEITVDARANQETWKDMMRLQEEGVYSDTFTAIHEPVIMLHDGYDSHPGHMVQASLEPHLLQLKCCEWKCCGYYRWLEKAAHGEFSVAMCEWLVRQFAKSS